MKNYQHLLFPYAYNILGSAEDAKDAVQDVVYNFLAAHKEGMDNEKNYLIKSVINQSINIKNKRKKLQYGDMWLPEPVATEAADTDTNLKEIVSYSLLVLLEQLNAKERAVFILKEAFAYSHEEIATTLSTTVENSRKLLSRAKAKLSQLRQPLQSSNSKTIPAGILEKYLNAIRSRDTQTLETVLSEDIAFFADGGTTMNVVAKTRTGLHEVAGLLIYIYHKFDASLSIVPTEINHQPALLFYDGPVLRGCQVLGISPDNHTIFQVSNVLDPEKLKAIGNR